MDVRCTRSAVLLSTLVLGLAASVVLAGGAAIGDLTPLGCIGNGAKGPASCASSANLEVPLGIAVSPDGQNVYVASDVSNALEVSSRAADGTLTPAGCMGDFAGGPANCNGAVGLKGARVVAVSHDGKSVYVGAYSTLNVFARAANGSLTSQGAASCIQWPKATTNCAATANLFAVDGLAVSPDDNNVYVAAGGSDAVEVMTRTQTGGLTPSGCLGDPKGGPPNCSPLDGLDRPSSVVISPDGKNVYVGTGDSIVVLNRAAATGSLANAGCIGALQTSAAAICSQTAHVASVDGLAFSPDGADLYATSLDNDAIEIFSRDASGALTEVGCVGNVGTGPKSCATSATGFASPTSVAVSPDGTSLYVTTSTGLVVFSRDASGMLTPTGCAVSDQSSGSKSCVGAPGLKSPSAVVVSPDKRNVYVTADDPGAVVEFARATTAPATTSTTSTGSTTAATTTTKPTPKKPSLSARLVYATVLKDKHGNLILTVRVRVSAPVTARLQLLGKHAAVLLARTFSLKNAGAATLAIALGPAVLAGTHPVTVTLTDAGKHTEHLSGTVLVQR